MNYTKMNIEGMNNLIGGGGGGLFVSVIRRRVDESSHHSSWKHTESRQRCHFGNNCLSLQERHG